ncbi:hypothetical protein KIN20_037253 [Parelaphostrongylus tenuis]|uniref:Uncharacterized protein n=1 Tax=Parelaphostrongylus tenuis TaxID=148309 RepID=A0AAD5RDP1_PARTN|nr:hypothetical protein KIN20_037253 [Parelaphostrongylus tenuis]
MLDGLLASTLVQSDKRLTCRTNPVSALFVSDLTLPNRPIHAERQNGTQPESLSLPPSCQQHSHLIQGGKTIANYFEILEKKIPPLYKSIDALENVRNPLSLVICKNGNFEVK